MNPFTRLRAAVVCGWLAPALVMAATFNSVTNGGWREAEQYSPGFWRMRVWQTSTGVIPGAGDTVNLYMPVSATNNEACAHLYHSGQLTMQPHTLSVGGDSTWYAGQLQANVQFLSGTFTWNGGSYLGAFNNPATLVLATEAAKTLTYYSTIENLGTIRQTGGVLEISGNPNNAYVYNRAGALYDIQADGTNMTGNYGTFYNYGTLRKSTGSGTSCIRAPFHSIGGTIDVQVGTLALGAEGLRSNTVLNVAGGAKLDLTGGANGKYIGTFTGNALGEVGWSSGQIGQDSDATFVLTNGLHWGGGDIWASTVRNQGLMLLEGTGTKTVRYYGQLHNHGTLQQTGGTLAISGNPNNAYVFNHPGALFDIRNDGTNVTTDYGLLQNNAGTIRKSAGTGTSVIAAAFDSWGGTLDVRSGRLDLRGDGTRSNITVNVASGATLDLTGGNQGKYIGLVTGRVDGVVQWETGRIAQNSDVTFALTNGFYWKGGELWAAFLHNDALLTLSGPATKTIQFYGQLENRGTVRHEGGKLLIQGNPNTAYVFNRTGGVFDIRFDGTNMVSNYGIFKNEGTLQKSAGGGESVITAEFENWNGTVAVQTGTLVLASSSIRSNGVLQVAAGATLDLTGGVASRYNGTFTGTGSGVVQWASGSIANGSDATFDLAGGLYWRGGDLVAAFLHNRGLLVLEGAVTRTVRYYGQVHNYGVCRHEGGSLNIFGNPNTAYFVNEAGGLYDIRTDGTVMTENYGAAQNYGTVRKSAGAGTSTLAIGFSNYGGAIAATAGTLWFDTYTHYDGAIRAEGGNLRFPGFTLQAGRLSGTNTVTVAGTLTSQGTVAPGLSAGRLSIAGAYSQGASGTLEIELGGASAGVSHDQLAVTGNASLGGALAVSLLPGYQPAGLEQYAVLAAGSRSGVFASTNLPALANGLTWQVQYGNTAVVLVVETSTSTSSTTSTSTTTTTSTTSSSTTTALGGALDDGGLTWGTRGDGLWFRETAVTHDGVDAAQSAPVMDGQQSWLETQVQGPGIMTFWWKVSSAALVGYLELFVDQTEVLPPLSGEQDWRQQTYAVGPGEHTFSWAYYKEGTTVAGTDAGYLDQVSWQPADGYRTEATWDQGAVYWSSGWSYLNWFGYYSDTDLVPGWIWHQQHDYLYIDPAATPGNIWFWMTPAGWIWTTSSQYPYLYGSGYGLWFWYSPGSDNPRLFYNTRNGRWYSL